MSFKDGVMEFKPKYKLINTANNNAVIDCDYIKLCEPRTINKGNYRTLKQYVDKALKKAIQENKNESETEENSFSQQKTLLETTLSEHEEKTEMLTAMISLAIAGMDDMEYLDRFIQAFKKVLIQYGAQPVGLLNGEIPINQGIWEAIHMEDQERMAKEYCSFFGIGSVGKLIKESGSASEQPTEVKAI